MGRAMAARLIGAGHEVRVWNRTPGRADGLLALGATEAATPSAAALGADAVVSMVADDAASTCCWLAQDGALSALQPGALMIECSTISHEHAGRLAKAAAACGCAYLDCPVNGPPTAAEAGDLVLLVGANAADLERARPLLTTLSGNILHFGVPGTGTAYKLINNLLGAVHVAAMAEAAVLARAYGIDADTMVEAIRTGPIASRHTVRMAAPMLNARPADSTGLAIGLREKDARYCLAMAHAAGITMPVGERAHGWYAEAVPTVGDGDDSMLYETVAHGTQTRTQAGD